MKKGLKHLKKFILQNKENAIILVDKHTYALCYPLLESDIPYILVPYGESYKNLNSCEFIWKKLIELSANRDTVLICLGGGVLCDMGSFAGMCFQRGMPVVLVPTSLLAMVDASIGGKNGVDFLGLKNYIGHFNQPKHIFVCPEFLDTLPYTEKVNGLVEMLKHGLIADPSHFESIKALILNKNPKIDFNLLEDSICIKENIVSQDFHDHGIRKRLNFGHTIGHAIEAYSLHINDENEALSHGLSVALGIVVESYLSTIVAGLSSEELENITYTLRDIIRPILDDVPPFEDLLPYLKKDKKNNNETINFSLISSIGVSRQDFEIQEQIICEGLIYLINIS